MKSVKQANTTVRVILYTSKTLANGEHPIMLCVTSNKKRKYLAIGFSCTKVQWKADKGLPSSKHPNYQLIKKIISDKISAYDTAILELGSEKKDFTPETLVINVEQPVKRSTLHTYFETQIEQLVLTERIKYAMSFKDTLRVLKQFKANDMPLSDIDVKFCKDLELFMRKKKFNDRSMSVYFRTLRVVLNNAIKDKCLRKQHYPFEEYKIAKFDLKTQKRAATKGDKEKIEALSLDPKTRLFRSRMFFLFSYYVRGINFVDIAKLRWSNIQNGRLHYIRSKTKQVFNIKLLPQAEAILEMYRPMKQTANDYIFDILDTKAHQKADQINNRLHKVLGQTNTDLKEIGKMIGFEMPLTMYVARHTYATTLKHSGVSIGHISEAMGHATEAITHTYLKDFENDVLDEADKHL